MKSRKITTWQAFKNIGGRRLVLMILVIVVSVGIIVAAASFHYQSEKRNLSLQGELLAHHTAEQLENYLITNKHALALSGYVVNNMIRQHASSEDILEYITEESERMRETLDEGFAGLYGVFSGKYLDGAGWVPDSDYVPQERPWYQAALKMQGALAFVDPYVDLKTGNVMMTIAELLDDGESVIALDLPMNGLQDLIAEVSGEVLGGETMVLDHDGCVIAHSVTQEIGKHYAEEQTGIGSLIVQKINDAGDEEFEIKYDGRTYVVYDQEIEDGWHCISVIDSDDFYNPLNQVLAIGIAMVVLIIAVVLLIFIRLSRRMLVAQDLNIQLSTIADIYTTIIDIDLPHNTFTEIVNKEDFDRPAGRQGRAQEALFLACDAKANELSKEILHQFLDLSTLPERLKDRTDIAVEFLDNDRGWCRGRFIVAARNRNGELTRVLWAIECIDTERKEREHLLHLAETDLLSGLFNRISGEQKIEFLLEQGRKGMFVMIDIDHFKSINDTYGHNVGDQAIIQVAACLRSAFRTGDIVLRMGGDEFAAYAPGVFSQSVSDRILSRFLRQLDENPIEALGDMPLSVSIGVAFCKKEETISFQELYQNADQCLYESKKKEGHQVTYHQ